MKFLILFGLFAAVIGDLVFLDGEYTRAVGHKLYGVADALRHSSESLWGT